MDALRKDDLARARATSFEERAAQALSAMRSGIRIKRAALRARHPGATDGEIEQRLQRWLERARELLGRIAARGFDRGQDLDAKLDVLLKSAREQGGG